MDTFTWVRAQLEQQDMKQVYTGIAVIASVGALQLYRWNEHRKVRFYSHPMITSANQHYRTV